MYSDIEIGETLRKLRLNKGYSIAHLCQEDMTTSFLSKVERGNSRISADKFLLLLERLHIDLNEFLFILRENKEDEDYQMRRKVQPFINSRDIPNLKKMLLEAEENSLPFITRLHIASFYYAFQEQTLSKKYLDELLDNLFTVEQWGEYEITIFAVASIAMDTQTLFTYGREMMTKKAYFKENDRYYRQFIGTCLNIADKCIRSAEYRLAEYFIGELEDFGISQWLVDYRLSLKFARNFLDYQKSKDPKYLAELERCVEFCDFLGLDFKHQGLVEAVDLLKMPTQPDQFR